MSFEKINRIRSHEMFINGEIDAIFITKPANVIYILGFKIESEVFIIIPKEENRSIGGKILVFINALDYDESKKKIELNKELRDLVEVKVIPTGVKSNFVQKNIKKLKLNSVGFEDDYISVKKFNEWTNKFKINKFVGASEILNRARIIKTQEEIERMKRAAELGDIGFKVIYNSIEAGMTEKELAAEAEYAMRKSGSEGTSFDMIIASGDNSAYPHSTTSEKKIKDGDIVLVDIGAIYKGYCSDMTRTFIFGNVNPLKARLINLVNEGQQFALDNIKDGLKCVDLDKLVRDFFIKKDQKLGSRFIHGLGHGVGIEIHEDPYISPVSKLVLKKNMVVTIEPGLYHPGIGGARTEDQIVVKENGIISLTSSKKYYY
ncbi:MAG: M24 family metallopeptidase [Promethearchaeota archaeon]